MAGMNPGPSYEYFEEEENEENCDYDSIDYWFQKGVAPDDDEQEAGEMEPESEELQLEPVPEEEVVTVVECVYVDADPKDRMALLVPRDETKGMMHEEVILERLRQRYDCDLERFGCLAKNCGRFFKSYAQLAFHLSYSHRDAKEPGAAECLVCGIMLNHSKGRVTHMTTKHRTLASEHAAICMQQRQAQEALASAAPLASYASRKRLAASRFNYQPPKRPVVEEEPEEPEIVYVLDDSDEEEYLEEEEEDSGPPLLEPHQYSAGTQEFVVRREYVDPQEPEESQEYYYY
ncbi:hypothetical protein L596_024982 [Steinernema carpocapsae]|uniref:C2H2-type domain-containing protein n=1 Tax=Steinernema carpocapsae TaxID=34508 RepID=A0A4V5ZYN6_STECR|nr:hypothetical protein L596_024982 [Steinernema carpocapsae]